MAEYSFEYHQDNEDALQTQLYRLGHSLASETLFDEVKINLSFRQSQIALKINFFRLMVQSPSGAALGECLNDLFTTELKSRGLL